jgi:hypothetical protein
MARQIQLLVLTLLSWGLICTTSGFTARPSSYNRLVEVEATSSTRLTAFQADRKNEEVDDDDDDDFSLEAFQQAKKKQQKQELQKIQVPDDFDGYALRDVIFEKWGSCYDVAFNRVDALGFRKLYLNIMPYKLGRRPFRHETELDYLCHLQAVVEILQKYEQLDYVLEQISDTEKKPIAGRVPIVAVPIRLDLTKDQVNAIIG